MCTSPRSLASRPLTTALLLGALLLVAWLAWGNPLPDDGAQRVMWLGDERFRIELATTPSSRLRGLMHRPPLTSNEGMLFIYPDEAPRSFWMKNVSFAIDILYLDVDWRLVHLHAAVPPCRSDPCPGYPSQKAARYVLELPAGTASRLSLEPGTRLDPPLPAGVTKKKAPE
ncbi:DUF192 domain-containing protein [Guyparkeria sp. GHLCS8-2]|uniref:DUF192 domain-containing protein n=1 Tax=Guyparkeria halopsychrophila TaxID=3139421 RepID=UPI0037C857B6